MEYDFDIGLSTVVKKQAFDALSRHPTKATDGSEINDEITLWIIVTFAQNKPTVAEDDTSEPTDVETNEPQVPTLVESMSAQSTDTCCESIPPTIEIAGSYFNFDKRGF